MPELPEVETTCCGIAPHITGKVVQRVIVREPRLRWPVPADLAQVIEGQRLLSVSRRAKYLLLEFEHGHAIWHLGMSGSLRVLDASEQPLKHDHVDLQIDSGKILRLNDPRRFGCMLYQGGDDPMRHWLLNGLGVEPLGNEFSGGYLHKLSRNRKVAVKNFIMDGRIVVGVGNIYAAETLFLAGVRPATAAKRIPLYVYDRIAGAIREVLGKAVRQGGTTLRDFVGSDGKPGYFKQQLNVYGRQGEPCNRCMTLLKLQILGQRSTVYCPICQPSQGFARSSRQ